METHKIFSGLAGWVLLIGLCIYAWFISFKPESAVPLSSQHSGKTYTAVQTLPVVPVTWQLTGNYNHINSLAHTTAGGFVVMK